MPRLRMPLIERLMAKVEKQDGDGCWLWAGGKNNNGYGHIGRGGSGGKKVLTHRASFEHFVGQIPDGLCVLHSCDIPACVNPDHLFLGTHKDNTADCVKKGRFANGEANGMAKLTETDVRAILSLAPHGQSHQAIATRFGVARRTIADIMSGKTWGHVV